MYSDAQRQLLLTYNDFAVECFQKSFYDEAIILLNKAIKGEKNEKGLYVNRGGNYLLAAIYSIVIMFIVICYIDFIISPRSAVISVVVTSLE